MAERLGILPVREMFLLYAQTDRRLRSEVSKNLESSSISLMEWLMLGILNDGDKKGISMTELSGKLSVSLPQVTAIMSGLMKKRLVRQRTLKKDRRSREALITQRGEDLLKDLDANALRAGKKIFANVQPGELADYQNVLRLISG